jgi:hypothetical protein
MQRQHKTQGNIEKKGVSGVGLRICDNVRFPRSEAFCTPPAVGLLGVITSLDLYISISDEAVGGTYDVFELGAEPGVTRGIRGPHHPHHLVRRKVRIVHRIIRLGQRERRQRGRGVKDRG